MSNSNKDNVISIKEWKEKFQAVGKALTAEAKRKKLVREGIEKAAEKLYWNK